MTIIRRAVCEIDGCNNLAERRNSNIGVISFRRYCNNHRRHLNGRLTGWERHAKRKKAQLDLMGNKCQGCGVSGPRGFLHFHHWDGDYGNDALENLALLCPNCHRKEHLKKEEYGITQGAA